MNQLFYAVNVVLLGYVITIASMLLNFSESNKLGIILVILSWTAAYFSDLDYVWGTNHPVWTRCLQWLSVIACGLSLASWYF